MIGLTSPEVYNSNFNINTTNNKFEFYRFPDKKTGGVSSEKVRDEIEKDFDESDITDADLEDDIIGPIFLEEHQEQVSKRLEDGAYMNNSASYPSSVFQDFESYLRTVIDLVGDDKDWFWRNIIQNLSLMI